MEYQIRLATLDDLSRLAVINSLGNEEGRVLAEKELPRFITSQDLIVYEENGKIEGLLYWERRFFGNNGWFLTQVTVAEESRRKGIGEKLWKWFLDYAQENSVRKVFCDIKESNLPSLNLAKKLGGKDAGSLDLGDGDVRRFVRFDI